MLAKKQEELDLLEKQREQELVEREGRLEKLRKLVRVSLERGFIVD